MRKLLLSLALILLTATAFAHGVQVAYTTLPNGYVRIYVEHWHGAQTIQSLQGNGMSITTTYGGNTVTQNLNPSGAVNATTVGNLPYGPVNVLKTCSGYSNYYNDWAFYDFAPAACGIPISITLNQGLTVVLEEACSDLYPVTINATFTDQAPPTLTCPAPVANVACGIAGTNVNFAATATDNCGVASITYSIAPGSFFPIGTTNVTATATDVNGFSSQCTFPVKVQAVDNTPPTVVSQNVTVQLNASGSASIVSGQAFADVFLETFNQATDGLAYALSNWNFAQSGMNVDVGDYISNNNAKEIDLAGNNNAKIISKRSFYLLPGQYRLSFDNRLNNNPTGNNSVRVVIGTLLNQTFASQTTASTESAIFTVATATSVNLEFEELGLDDAAGSFISNIRLSRVINPSYSVFVSATDDCGVDGISVSKSTFDCSNLGANTVVLTVRDVNGNQTQQNVTVTVVDNIRPTLTPAANQDVNLSASCTVTVPDVRGTARDNCSATITQSPAAGTEVPSTHNGVINVVVTATDPAGNTDVKTVVLTAKDVIAPTITSCPPNINVSSSTNQCGAMITYALPVARDNCSGGAFNYFNAGEPNNAGGEDYLQLYNSATWNDLPDFVNNRSIVEFNTITNNSFANYSKIGDYGGHSYYISTTSATWQNSRSAAQAIGGDLASINTLGESQYLAPYGGNTWVGGYQDHSDPDYAEPGNASQNWGGWKWVDGTKLGAGQITINRTSGFASGTLFPVGTTVVTHTATDQAGNSVSCSFTVTVTDNQNPVITTNGNKVVNTDAGRCDALVLVSASATDNCTVSTPTGVRSDNQPLNAPYPKGVTTITWNVTDVNGNAAATVTQTVTVTDNQPPVLTPGVNQTINVDGSCSVTIPDVRGTATDNCGAVTIIQSPAAGTVVASSHNSTINVIVTATDAAGLTTVKTVVITAKDVTPPSITCPASISVNTDPNACGAVVTYATPTATDNCVGPSGSFTFTYTGQIVNWVVPQGVTSVRIVGKGARGGNLSPNSVGGNGAQIEGNFSVTPGETLKLLVAGAGIDGRPFAPDLNAGGGGGTFVWTANGNSLLLAAGGGSGAGGCAGVNGSPGLATLGGNGQGGEGGIRCGVDLGGGGGAGWLSNGGATSFYPNINGKSALNGGQGGVGGSAYYGYAGTSGGFGGGGAGSGNCGGAGGGGGYTGGLGADNGVCTAGAHYSTGGTSYNIGTNQINTSGVNSGNGEIIISYGSPAATVSLTSPANTASGSVFPVGTTTVTYEATDAAGLKSTCSFTVTVTDNQIPVITHNGNKNVLAQAGRCDAIVNVSATASDNCVVGSPVGVRSDARPLSDPYPVGTTTITWNVTDVNGNAAITQTQTITVTDNQKPVINNMPQNITKSALVNNCLALITWPAPIATDNCGIASFSSNDEDYNSLGFTLLPVGVHTITYTATDIHGNVQTASFTVTVVDNQNPIITGCPGTISVTNAPGTCGQQVFWNPPTASDNCPGVTMTGSHVPGSIFPVGTTVVTYTATDAVGLVTTCSFNVVVTDNEKPVVSNCPANITVNTGAGNTTCRQTATWLAPTATDNCGNVTVSSTHQPGAIFAIGTTTVTYTFTDVHNNVSTCSFDVTVVDNTAPVPNVASLPTITAECSATASVPTATDNCGGVIYGVPSGPTSFTTQGTHTIIWTYTDAAGNTSSQTQTVVIDDITPPVIACPFDIVVNATPGTCGAVVTYNQPSATDNCGGGNLPTSLPGYTYKGTYNGHSYFVSNTQAKPEAAHAAAIGLGGHLATISDAAENALISGFLPGQRMWIGFTDRDVEGTYRWVTNEPITYTNWSGGEPNNAGDEDWAVINWSGPTWNDWYYEQPAYYVVEFEGGAIPTTLVSGPASGSVFPVGTTVVTWSATDAGGNTVTCSFRVTVKDVEPPTITCPANINAIATSAAGAVVNYTAPVGTDNCSGAVTTRIAGPASGSTFPIGTTIITYRVIDAAGLTTQCSFTVTVVGVPPAINCPANIIVNNTQGQCGTNVNFAATETQAIPASTITYSHQPGSFFPVGTTTVTATATNPVGTSVCTFTVTVMDAENPRLVGVPSNETVECTEVPAAADVTATDNCGNLGAVQYTEVKANGNCAGNYTLTRTWSVTDAHNNTTTATQVITVVDTKAPVINTEATDATVECDGNGNTSAFQNWLNGHGGSAATDDCSGVTWTNNFTGNWIADCGGAKHVTVVFTATDGCGNASQTTATFRIKDETAPAIATAVGNLDRVVECSDESGIAAAEALAPSATDDCSQVTIHLLSDVVTPGCGSTYVRVREWNFTDACGNTSATFTQTITTKDETAPVITCPASVTLNCQDDNSTAATGEATATDNCSTPVISYNDVSTQSSNVNDAAHYNYTITRTWKAVDACSNVSTCVQVITVQDVTKPVITCPASVTVNCQDDNTSAATGKATATDNCGPVAITETQTSTQNANINSPAHYNYTITRTWRATDVTGNYSECTQTITVQDITKPVAVCKPVTITLVNGSASIVATDIDGGSSDNCSPLTFTVSKSSFNCSNIGANTVTLTVKDVSGNVSTCQATVNVVGEIPTCKITSVPTSNVYTGGNPNSLYLGYGAQSTMLKLDVPASGAPYTFSWSGNGTLSSTTVQSPLFAPTTAGLYTFTVFITNKYGCTTSCTISICVTDVRVMNAKTGTWDGKKVYVCHVPPGNPGNSNTLEISVNAVPAHIGASGHGTDRLGKCEVPVCTAPVYARGGTSTEVAPKAYASEIKAYPNPTTGVFALLLQNYSKGKVEIQVVDNYGKLVANQSVTVMNQSENVTIDVTKHAAGVYHVRVLSEDGVKTLRVVVAR